jgi:hypothetical protein
VPEDLAERLHDLQIAQSTEIGDEGSARDMSNKSPSHALVAGSNESISAATGMFAICAKRSGTFPAMCHACTP